MTIVVVAPTREWFDVWRRMQYPQNPYCLITCLEDTKKLHYLQRPLGLVILDYPVRPGHKEAIEQALRLKGLI